MAPNPRFDKAINFMRALGISDREVNPVLTKLLAVYGGKWELIEDDNYQALVDAYFDFENDKEVHSGRKANFSCHGGEKPIQEPLLVDDDNQDLSILDSSSQMLCGKDKKISPETSEQRIFKPSQTFMEDSKPKTSSHSSHKMLSEVEKISDSKDRKSYPEKASLAGPEKASSTLDRGQFQKELVKPRTKKPKLELTSTNPNGLSDASRRNLYAKPLSTHDQDVQSRDVISTCNNDTSSYNGDISIASSSRLGEVKLYLNCDSALGQPNFSVPNLDLVMKFMDKKYLSSCNTAGIPFSMAKLLDDFCRTYLKLGYRKGSNSKHANSQQYVNQGDCLSSSLPCGCAQETGGEFAYNTQGSLKEEFLTACVSMKNEPQAHHYVYCQECPLEKSKNEVMPERCKGHMVRKFIKECWRKCGCDMQCGNRIVQRGITSKLQVFLTREGKGWGLRTLEDLPKGTFVCEYVGEILTNMELYDRIMQKNSGKDRHTYPVTLDADWGSERVLKDEEALCLDATYTGNVGRFINHRCYDANLIDIPVEIESPDHHYYHLAFFTNREVSAYEELTWDYGIDFDDHDHPIKAFRCCCGSAFCCDKKKKGKGKIENQVHAT